MKSLTFLFALTCLSAYGSEDSIQSKAEALKLDFNKILELPKTKKLTREIEVDELMEMLGKYGLEAGELNLGGMDSGGGDSVSQEFMGIAHDVAAYLKSHALDGLDTSRYEASLDGLRIYTVNSLFREGKELDAINIPKFKTILLSRERWDAQRDNIKRERLVLHEILGVMGEADANYQISYKYKSESSTVYNGRAFKLFKPISREFYGVAFGIKGQMVDFELIEREGRGADFLIDRADKGLLCNYIVDVLNNQILHGHDNCGDFIDANLGEMHYGNHYSYNVDVVPVKIVPYEYSSDYHVLVEHSSMKWWGGISSFLLVKRTYGNSEVISKCENECVGKFTEQIYSKLSASDREFMQDLGANDYTISITQDDDGYDVMQFEETYYRPKSDDSEEFNLKASVRIRYEGSELHFDVLSVVSSR